MIDLINKILSLGVLSGQAFLIVSIVYMLINRNWAKTFMFSWISKRGMLFAWLIATSGTFFSLFYSNIAGFAPCDLCWLQRIFFYPQVVLLGMALWKKDFKIIDYSLALAAIGTVISVYHNYIYYGGTSLFNCEAFGLGVSCTKRYVFEFGYVTIPLMSLTVFLLMIFFLILQKRHHKNSME